MNITSTAQGIIAIGAVVGMAFGAAAYFQTQSAAAADKQQTQQTIEELRAEILLDRVQLLNEKEEKGEITAAEKTERELKLKLVAKIQADAIDARKAAAKASAKAVE